MADVHLPVYLRQSGPHLVATAIDIRLLSVVYFRTNCAMIIEGFLYKLMNRYAVILDYRNTLPR